MGFDAYTIAFGLRNVTNLQIALQEAYRVLKPGGRFMCLEFSKLTSPILDKFYDFYSFVVIFNKANRIIIRSIINDINVMFYRREIN